MAHHDTDPHEQAPGGPEPTEPGAPPSAAEDDAAALLADFARAPMPVEGVRETAGEMAAAAAVAPHRPPRATVAAVEEQPVVLNTTQPLPIVSPSPPPAGDAVSSQGADTIEDFPRARLLHTTAPSVKVKSKRRVYLAAAAIVSVCVGVAAAILALAPRDDAMPRAATAALSASPSVAAPTAAPSPSASPAAPVASVIATASIAHDAPPAPSPPTPPSAAREPRPVQSKPHASIAPAPPPHAAAAAAASPPPSARPSPTATATSTSAASSGDFPWRQ